MCLKLNKFASGSLVQELLNGNIKQRKFVGAKHLEPQLGTYLMHQKACHNMLRWWNVL